MSVLEGLYHGTIRGCGCSWSAARTDGPSGRGRVSFAVPCAIQPRPSEGPCSGSTRRPTGRTTSHRVDWRVVQDQDDGPNADVRALIRAIDVEPSPDPQLLNRIQRVLRVIVTRYAHQLLSAAAALRDLPDMDPEDALQDALAKFAKRLLVADFRQRMAAGSPYSFLWTMTCNRSRDLYTSHSARRRLVASLIRGRRDEGPQARPDQGLQDRDRRQAASELLRQLPEEDRQLVVLVCVEDRSSEEGGALVQKKASAVRKRISRALATLRASEAAAQRVGHGTMDKDEGT